MRCRALRSVGAAALSVLTLAGGAAAAAEEGRAATRSRQGQAYLSYSMAQQALLQRDYADAVAFMEQAAARDGSPDLLLEVARLHLSLNNLPRAAELSHRALEASPQSSEAYELLGEVHLEWARAGRDPEKNLSKAIEAYRTGFAVDPDNERIGRSLGELLYQLGRLSEASEHLVALQRRHPLDVETALLLAKIHVRMGRTEDAQILLERIVAGAPLNVEAADTLGAIYESQELWDQAIAVYEPLLRVGPDNGYLHARVGALHLKAGRSQQAIEELEAAIELEPDDERALLNLARAYEEAGDSMAAISTYQRILEMDGAHLEASFHLARLQEQTGDTAAALESLRAIVARVNDGGTIEERDQAVLALAYSQIGLLEMESRNLAQAADAFERALNASSEPDPDLFLLLGRARLQLGDLEAAKQVIAEAIRRHPDDLDLMVLKGEMMVSSGEKSDGTEFFRTLLHQREGSAEAYLRVGEALLRQRSSQEAESILREATQLYPSNDQILFVQGAALEQLGRVEEAEKRLLHAIGLNPQNAMALNYLGYMLADRGLRLDDSVAYVERALELDPENPAYLDSLGWAQFKLARYGPAEENLRAAVLHDQNDPTIREHLGDLLMATGRVEEAVAEWETALGHGHERPDRLREKVEKARASLGASP